MYQIMPSSFLVFFLFFLPDFPFLDNEFIYVISECPELAGNKLGGTDFC